MNGIGKEFYLLTQSLLSHHRSHITDGITDVLTHAFHDHANRSNYSSVLVEQIYQAKSSDILIKLFEKRTCQMSFVYPLCVKIFDFLYSLSFGINRHTLAIFLGNALPSFIVFLANLLSLRAIFCSKSLKYLKQTTRKTRRKRRLQSDLRAFLVIAIQSFSVIMITWGIPIFLTMYHCRTLYVISIAACPQIKHTLAVFLFTDLFNSSTNCLLYSLSGKLFRRKFLATLKSIVTCGRGLLWHVRSSFSHSRRTNTLDSLPSTHANNCAVQSRAGSFRQAEFLSSVSTRKAPNPNLISRLSDEDRSVSNSRADDESILNQSLNSDRTNHRFPFQRLEESRSIKSYFLDKIRSIRSRPRNDSTQEKTKLNSTTPENQHRSKHASSPPSPRLTTPGSSASVRSINNYSATKSILPPSGTKVVLIENVTSLWNTSCTFNSIDDFSQNKWIDHGILLLVDEFWYAEPKCITFALQLLIDEIPLCRIFTFTYGCRSSFAVSCREKFSKPGLVPVERRKSLITYLTASSVPLPYNKRRRGNSSNRHISLSWNWRKHPTEEVASLMS